MRTCFAGLTCFNSFESKIEDYFNSIFPLPENSPKILVTGRFGTGKSFMIKRFMALNYNINFPFTDTSRTTTYKTEYILRESSKSFYKFLVSFYSYNHITQQIQYCIDRALDTKLDLLFKSNNSHLNYDPINDSEEDILIDSFNSDSNNTFDLRFILGSYYKTDSREKYKKNRTNQIEIWENIYNYLCQISDDILGDNPYDFNEGELDLVKYKLNDYSTNAYEDQNSNYTKLTNYIIKEITNNIENTINNLNSLHCFNNINIEYENDNSEIKWIKSIYCNILNFKSSDFEDFIKHFTSRKGTYFGSLLTPFINMMRIEVPYNQNINSEFHSKSLVFIDTVGINHSTDSSTSIENSTSFSFDKVDITLVVDDSRSSMASDTQNILKHLFDRVITDKIYLMYSFFNELSKSEFVEEESDIDDLNDKKIRYLYRIQNNKIYNLLENNLQNRRSITKSIQSRTYFFDKTYDSYTYLNRFLSDVFHYYSTANNYLLVNKKDSQKPLLEYDFKKLPIIFFNEIQNKYFNLQSDIYIKNYPHYKTTEALTLRLSQGATSFYGAKILKPVDDLYTIIIDRLTTFIFNPKIINFVSKNDMPECENKILDKLKEMVSEKLSKLSESEFTTPALKNMWKNLYLQSDIGADYRRRVGIIDTMNHILPSMNIYLTNNSEENWIDKIENIILTSIDELEEIVQIELQNNKILVS